MFSHMMNQKFTLKIVDGTDENGMPYIAETKSNISCRKTYKNKLIISSTGQQITSEGSIFSYEPSKVGDIVVVDGNEHTVITSAPVYDFENNLQGYKLYF